MEAQLALPPFPLALDYLWSAYHRIRGRTGGNGYGPNPISWEAIDAFCRRAGRRFYPWEVELLEAVDDAFLAAAVKQG